MWRHWTHGTKSRARMTVLVAAILIIVAQWAIPITGKAQMAAMAFLIATPTIWEMFWLRVVFVVYDPNDIRTVIYRILVLSSIPSIYLFYRLSSNWHYLIRTTLAVLLAFFAFALLNHVNRGLINYVALRQQSLQQQLQQGQTPPFGNGTSIGSGSRGTNPSTPTTTSK